MNTRLAEYIEKVCFVYIDDIVIYSSDITTHLQHLQQVYACLQNAGLTLNMEKKSAVPKITVTSRTCNSQRMH